MRGLEVLPPFVAWHVPYISDEERGAILLDYRRRLATLGDVETMRFPSLVDYDGLLHPLKNSQPEGQQ